MISCFDVFLYFCILLHMRHSMLFPDFTVDFDIYGSTCFETICLFIAQFFLTDMVAFVT